MYLKINKFDFLEIKNIILIQKLEIKRRIDVFFVHFFKNFNKLSLICILHKINKFF